MNKKYERSTTKSRREASPPRYLHVAQEVSVRPDGTLIYTEGKTYRKPKKDTGGNETTSSPD